MNVLVSIHVVGEVTCQLPEQPDLGPQLQLHLGKKTHTNTRTEVSVIINRISSLDRLLHITITLTCLC